MLKIFKKLISYFNLKSIANSYAQAWRVFKDRPPHRFNSEWDVATSDKFLAEKNFKKKYEDLFSYFLTGAVVQRGNSKSCIHYRGYPSSHGAWVDSMEGFSRFAPLAAAWIASGRSSDVSLINSKKVNLLLFLKEGFCAGTDPVSEGYWGRMKNCDQRIVEAHDIALSLWFLRERSGELFTASELSGILNWLAHINECEVVDNNWHLFTVLVNLVLKQFGYGYDSANTSSHFKRIKDFYLDNGWFIDGPGGSADYYNAWAIQYSLFWINEIEPDFERDFIEEVRKRYFESYRYFITPQGYPAFGRSLIYRTAASVPHLINAYKKNIDIGEAARAFDCLWSFFVKKGCLLRGGLSQGLEEIAPNFLDPYSGPASPLWGLRSMILAFYFSPESPFWKGDFLPLPIEKADYRMVLPELNWEVIGDHKAGAVTIVMRNNSEKTNFAPQKYTYLNRFIETIFLTACRPNNHRVKYLLPKYISGKPFYKTL